MLPNYQTVLVATDFTPHSDHAFRHAVMLARQHQAGIYLLHVVPRIDASVRSYIASVMGDDNLEKFEKTNEQEAQQKVRDELDQFARTELADHPEDLQRFAGVEVVHGSPVDQILQTAERLEADVIVMGTHSKGVLEHSFLGSVAEKVLQKAARPVFVVPLPK